MNSQFQKILVPTDFSADAEEALRVASELSRAYAATLTLIHVYDPIAYPLPDGYVMYTPGQLSNMLAEFDKRLARAKESAIAAAALGVTTRVLQGSAAAEIVRFATDEAYDLIVIGTHGRTGLPRFLLGSIAERVVQTAACPVLTVKRAGVRASRVPGEPAVAIPSA
jgi:nucleotide-binding universal stress UspA family protein